MAEPDEPFPAWSSIEQGEGPPVVFLHGYPLNHSIWTPQLRSLSNSHRVVLFDLPGYGLAQESPVPSTLKGFAEGLSATLARQFSGPVVVVGHSFGGYIALELYRSHPGQFRGLVLTDTRSEADDAPTRAKRLATVQRLSDPAEGLDIEATVRALLAPATLAADGPIVGSVREIVRSVRSPAIIGSLRAIAGRDDLTPVLAKIRVPTLVVWGNEDQLIPPVQTESMVDRIRGGSGVGISGAGHLPFLESPDEFSSALHGFLERLASPAPGTAGRTSARSTWNAAIVPSTGFG
jgi:pimeloyl-ACP methyl ester carboxylesterase